MEIGCLIVAHGKVTTRACEEVMPEDDSPFLRGPQFDAGSTGFGRETVNLYRGQVTMPLPLVKLVGRNGLDLKLMALYSGVTGSDVTTWNMESATDVLGLGWSLPPDQIAAV